MSPFGDTYFWASEAGRPVFCDRYLSNGLHHYLVICVVKNKQFADSSSKQLSPHRTC
jgi:hypothetical protein